MDKLTIISATVRPGRKGLFVTAWVKKLAEQSGLFGTDFKR